MRLTAHLWRPRRSARVSRDARTRRDTHLTHEQSPQRTGIDAQVPNSMPRSEDDAITGAGSWDFHDRPGSGKDTARREFFF